MTIRIENKTVINFEGCGACEPLPVTSARDYHTDPISDDDIQQSVSRVLDEVGSSGRDIGQRYFAIGIQSYQWVKGEFVGTGPLADLYPLEERSFTQLDSLNKIGFHNQHMAKPSWAIHRDGQKIELLAASAKKVSGATGQDVPWLYVELEDNPWNIKAIVRSHTRGGLAPTEACLPEFTRVGQGYMTLYTLIHC